MDKLRGLIGLARKTNLKLEKVIDKSVAKGSIKFHLSPKTEKTLQSEKEMSINGSFKRNGSFKKSIENAALGTTTGQFLISVTAIGHSTYTDGIKNTAQKIMKGFVLQDGGKDGTQMDRAITMLADLQERMKKLEQQPGTSRASGGEKKNGKAAKEKQNGKEEKEKQNGKEEKGNGNNGNGNNGNNGGEDDD